MEESMECSLFGATQINNLAYPTNGCRWHMLDKVRNCNSLFTFLTIGILKKEYKGNLPKFDASWWTDIAMTWIDEEVIESG